MVEVENKAMVSAAVTVTDATVENAWIWTLYGRKFFFLKKHYINIVCMHARRTCNDTRKL